MKSKLYMTFRFRYLIVFLMLFLLVIAFAVLFITEQSSINAMSETVTPVLPTVIIDAGHGGEDGGTQSSSGILEKDVNLQISRKLNLLLKALGYKTVMLRDEDKMLYTGELSSQREKKVSDIKNRMNVINTYPDALFLSIHQNYFTESKYNGTQVFYSPNNAESRLVAQSVQDSVITLVQNKNTRKIKQSGKEIYLLYHANNPAVMVECGFLSNPGEALLLNDSEYQKKISLAIINGINRYYKGKN